jgi:DNA-3-methyladenine glycosylase
MTSPQPFPMRRGISSKKLPRSFYLRPTLTVAKDLLGKYFIRKIRGKFLVGKIVEVEAYLGENDPASHAYRGKTKRNEVMFLRGRHLYVYFTYGMHFCCNIVTEDEDKGRAVLLRAVEPIEGSNIMKRHRIKSLRYIKNKIDLTNGPAKLCEAFALKREQNGTNLLGKEIYITQGENVPVSKIISATRIGINNGIEKKWRFYIKGNLYVSKK